MPTYEYRCESCGHTFDAVQGFADDPLTTCNVCGGSLRKVFSAVGIVFKGSGFYKNDSRGSGPSRSGAKPGASNDGGADGSSSTADSTKSKESTGAPSTNGATPSPAASKSDAGSSGTSTSTPSTPSTNAS
jgi:putative FmdB family regulatory protein